MLHEEELYLAFVLLLSFLGGCNRDPNVAKKKYVENGNRYYEKGKYKEALIMYRNALKRDMRYGEAYYRSGLAEMKLGQWGGAARDLQRAVELQPDNLDAHTTSRQSVSERLYAGPEKVETVLTELKGLSDKLAQRFPEQLRRCKD